MKKRRRTKPVDKKILHLTDTYTQQTHTHAHTGGIKGRKKRGYQSANLHSQTNVQTTTAKHVHCSVKICDKHVNESYMYLQYAS